MGVINRTREKLIQAADSSEQFLDPVVQASLPIEQALLDASQVIDPARSQLQADIFAQTAPQLAGTYDQILANSRLAQARADADIASGAGRDAAFAIRDTIGQVDPEYMQNRELAGSRLAELLGDLSVDASGGELAEIERLSNRSNLNRGTDNTGSNTDAIRNAINFGEVRARRRGEISSSLGQALAGLQALRSGVSESVLRPSEPNAGLNAFLGTQGRATGDFTLQGSQPLIGGVNQAIQQKNQESLTDQGLMGDIAQGASIFGNLAGGITSLAGIGTPSSKPAP